MVAFMSWSLAHWCRTPTATRVPRGSNPTGHPQAGHGPGASAGRATSAVADTPPTKKAGKVRQLFTLSDCAQIWLIGASGEGRNGLHLGAPSRRSGAAAGKRRGDLA